MLPARIRGKWVWAVALVVVTALLAINLREIQWVLVWEELRLANPAWLVAAMAFNLLILGFWSMQWKAFLPKVVDVPLSRVAEIIALTATVLNTVPYMVGQASAVVLLTKRAKVGRSGALSVLALDQLLEGFGKISVFLLVAILIPVPVWLKQGIFGMAGGVLALFVVLLAFAHRHRHLGDAGGGKSWTDRLERFVARWAHQLEALRSIRIFAIGLILALAMKSAEATAIFAIQKSFGLDLPLWSVFLVLASLGLTTMVALVPGNIGVYEATVFFVYQYVGVSPEEALGLAVIQHVCYLLPLAGAGYLVLLGQNLRRPLIDHSLKETRWADET